MQNNKNVGLTLEEQAKALACMCQDRIACPSLDLNLTCKFKQSCINVRKKDWLEYLENRQNPVDNPAK